jgi:hypothetical protein
MTVRLLVPPGVCLCHLFEPEPPATSSNGPVLAEEHHHPGCPASGKAGTCWVPKAENPHTTILSDLCCPPLPVNEHEADTAVVSPWPANGWPDPHLYLTLRILRI